MAGGSVDTLAVGDLISIELTGQWPDTIDMVQIGWTAHPDTLLLAAVDSVSVETKPGWLARRYRLSVLPTREGRLTIPPTLLVASDNRILAATEPLVVEVTSHLDPEAEPKLRPLADMASLRNVPWLLLIVTVAVLAALVIAFLIWRRRRSSECEPLPPPIPPGEEFKDAIRQLLDRRMTEAGRMRDFTQELSWILRRYLGRRWDEPALEATRPEILRWLPHTDLTVSEQQLVTHWLEATDSIKFGGQVPLPAETEELTSQAREIVDRGEVIAAREEQLERETLLAAKEQEPQEGEDMP
jgi:hypothetical protein